MSLNHTPGPWQYHDARKDDPRNHYVEVKASPGLSFVFADDLSADARLIAEAPAMLDLVQTVAAGNTDYADLEAMARAILDRLQ